MTNGSVLPSVYCVRLWLVVLSMGLVCSSCQPQDEVEHLEHVAPEHKPASYSDAVAQLQRRIAEVLDGSVGDTQKAQPLTELGDIIRWLPENAADSDLKKSEWEQVEQISIRLAAWHTSLQTRSPSSVEQSPQMEQDIAQLVSLVKSSDRFQTLATQRTVNDER